MTDRRRIARADVPTTGGRKYDVIIEGEEGGGVRATQRIIDHMPHDEYHRRGWITAPQHQAADAMHKDFCIAGLQPLRCQDWVKLDRSDGEMADGVMDARRRFMGALKHLEPLGASLIWRVCGEGETAPEAGRRYGKNRKYSMERLREALQVIAEFKNLA